MMRTRYNQGFTIFFAVLVGSLALAIGLAIYDITIRELDLSQTATQSQYAVYAADTGAECALYWDFKCTASNCADGSAFATSTSDKTNGDGTAFPPPSGVTCNNVDVAAAAVAAGTWPLAGATETAATTTFTVTFPAIGSGGTQIPSRPYCAIVTVAKYRNPTETTVTSKGYNNCPGSVAGGATRLERVLQVSY